MAQAVARGACILLQLAAPLKPTLIEMGWLPDHIWAAQKKGGGSCKGSFAGGGGKGWSGKGKKGGTLASKGKAIVEFSSSTEAMNAIQLLDGSICDGRPLK